MGNVNQATKRPGHSQMISPSEEIYSCSQLSLPLPNASCPGESIAGFAHISMHFPNLKFFFFFPLLLRAFREFSVFCVYDFNKETLAVAIGWYRGGGGVLK